MQKKQCQVQNLPSDNLVDQHLKVLPQKKLMYTFPMSTHFAGQTLEETGEKNTKNVARIL